MDTVIIAGIITVSVVNLIAVVVLLGVFFFAAPQCINEHRKSAGKEKMVLGDYAFQYGELKQLRDEANSEQAKQVLRYINTLALVIAVCWVLFVVLAVI